MSKARFPSTEIVTINTDASFDPKANTGGFGIWIKSDFFTIKKWGQFKGEVTDANEAEIKAVVNAFYILSKNTRKFSLVVVNTDNKTVQDIAVKKRLNERFKDEGAKLLEYISEYKVVRVKHVRGHQRSTNARQFVNNWCDEASRKYKKK
jgi:ribonuclease HI